MLNGFATEQWEAEHPELWDGLVIALCPSATGPTGLTLLDFRGSKNGTFSGPTWVISSGQCALNCSSSSVSVANFDKIFPSRFISASVWYNTGTTINPTFPYNTAIFDNQSVSSPYPGVGFRGGSGNTFECSLNTGGTNKITNLGSFVQNTWTMVTATYDGSNIRGYRNGVLIATTAASGTIDSSTTTTLKIGDSGGFSGRYLQGMFDDFAVWDRALSASEVLSLYTQGRGVIFTPRQRRLFRTWPTAGVTAGGGSSFKAAWATRKRQIIGSGVI